MSRFSGAAGFAAAILLAAFGTLDATPSFAWQLDAPAITPAVLTTPPALVRPLAPSSAPAALKPAIVETPFQDEAPVRRSLAQMVVDRAAAVTSGVEQDCLATAVYFESKGEPLKGQLGVANVILNRTHSGGRFPRSVCGVVRQPGQFSFVHGGRLPHLPRASAAWKTAVAIADIAISGDAPVSAPKALFFHARYVSPGWRLTRVASIGNHVFYR